MKHLLFIFATFVLVSSCKKDEAMKQQEPTQIPEISVSVKSIKHGTSFGMCVGYCHREHIYTTDKATFKASGWNLKPLTYSKELSAEKWDLFMSLVNMDTFFDLPKTIGCPDCADGGAEWIEIENTLGQKHKVTFDYRKEPDSIKDLLAILRQFEWEWELKRK